MKRQQFLAPVGALVVGTLVATVALANSPPGGGVNYCEWDPDLYEWICYPTATPTPTPTPTPTDTPRPVATATPTDTPKSVATPTPTNTPRPVATDTPRPVPTPTPTAGPSAILYASKKTIGVGEYTSVTADVEPADIDATWALDDYDPATLKLWWSSSCTGKSSDTHAPNDLLPRPHTKVWGCRSGKGTVHLEYGGKSIGHIHITVVTPTATPTATPPKPGVVSGFSATVNKTRITLGWTHVTGIATYQVRQVTNSASASSPYLIEEPGSSYTIDVGCGVTRHFEIRASGDGITYQEAWGPWSASVSATTKACTPTPTPGDPPDPPTSTPTPTPPPVPTPTPVPASVKITHVIPGTEGAYVAIQWSPNRPTDVSNLTLEWETVNLDCDGGKKVCEGSAGLASGYVAWVVDGKFKPNTAYTNFKITAQLGSKKIEGWFKDANGNHEVVTTHPRPVIKVVSVFGEKSSPKFEDIDRSVFTYFTVKLVVPDAVRNAASSAQYKVVMSAPAGTGLQAKKSQLESCSYGSQPSAPWNRLDDPVAEFHLVRCSLGDGDTDLTVYATVTLGGSEYHVGTYARIQDVPQSLHQADNSITYHVRGTSGKTINIVETLQQEGMFPGLVPGFKMPTTTAFIDPSVYAKAAAVWHDLGSGLTITKGAETSYEVAIRGYWNDKVSFDYCPETVACVRGFFLGSHLIQPQTMWFENPPKWDYEAQPREWTTVFNRWFHQPTRLLYLPAFLVHELGHLLAFENSNEGPSIMNQGIHNPCGPDIAKCLTDADKKGLKAIYKSHSEHE